MKLSSFQVFFFYSFYFSCGVTAVRGAFFIFLLEVKHDNQTGGFLNLGAGGLKVKF